MFPTGDFDRLKYEIMEWYSDIDIPITFGILIADYEQSLAKEYIINYMDVFDKRSNRYIDFFIPGYVIYGSDDDIRTSMKNKQGDAYYFSRTLFHDFIEKFETYFDYKYEFNPVLILVELKNRNFVGTKKIVIELDSERTSIKKAGVLFNNIFEIAKRYVNITDFSRELTATYLKNTLADSVIDAIDNSMLTELYTQKKNIRVFQIK